MWRLKQCVGSYFSVCRERVKIFFSFVGFFLVVVSRRGTS